MSRVILLLMLVVFVAGCGASHQVTEPVDDKPVAPVVGRKPLGAPVWRQACIRLTSADLPPGLTAENFAEKADLAAHKVVDECMEGFMSLPGDAPDIAARCILEAPTREAEYGCIRNSLMQVPFE